jgi:hypothetical protein
MVHAELHSKLSQDGAGAHERMEDVLTSNVFGLIRYLPPESGLIPWLERSEPFGLHPPLRIEGTAPVITFWPELGTGEVDVMISVPGEQGDVDLVAVECKFESRKSGRAADAGSDTPVGCSTPREADQLAKYAHGLRAGKYAKELELGRSVRRLSLVYLTDDTIAPTAELSESATAMGALCERVQLYWLSWDTLHMVLRNGRAEIANPGLRLVADDLMKLLERKGMRSFLGFGASMRSRSPSGSPAWRQRWVDLAGARPLRGDPGWRLHWIDMGRATLGSGRWRTRGNGDAT